ncbi:hypothetical protein Q73_06815 [Bacillus coahuilensis m2-6]|uniref:hypothetical protein n=1 Tax=Bacillus coahuilensis TaxID=408580 RepID=UPI00075007A8|nr:hypothetical protein [Bacillus coahuilensis]KUP08226.1 hypothetical protein Q73_06815 [Bacillus coahuilensis m2-6]
MNLEKLLYYIGFFIFGSLLVLTFLQLHSHQGEALLFILVGALLYGGLVFTFYRKKAFWLIGMIIVSLFTFASFLYIILFQSGQH